MVGSRVSSRIAQRLIKKEENEGIDDNINVNNTEREGTSSSPGQHSSTPLIETPKRSSTGRRHTMITSSPSSVEEEDLFDGNSGEDIDDEEEDDDEVIVSTPLRRRSGQSMNRQKRLSALGEVDSARHKLDDLLAHISKGDSHEDEDYDEDDEQTDSSPHLKRRRSRHQKKLINIQFFDLFCRLFLFSII